MPAHSSSKNSGWGIKNSVAEHSLSQQNKERVIESKVCCTIGKKSHLEDIMMRTTETEWTPGKNRNKNQSRSQKHAIFV